jgi:hypothetical protein
MCTDGISLFIAGKPPKLERGVFEDPSPPAGYRHFRMIAGDGIELLSLRIHERAGERDTVAYLRAWLAEIDPETPTLRVLP